MSSDADMFDGLLIRNQSHFDKFNSSLFILDVLLPVGIVTGLFLLNAIVFIVIIRYRKRQLRDNIDRELADL